MFTSCCAAALYADNRFNSSPATAVSQLLIGHGNRAVPASRARSAPRVVLAFHACQGRPFPLSVFQIAELRD